MPALSHPFPSSYIGLCGICYGQIGKWDAICFDQDDQIVHDYCA